jgi:endo-1,4-beta-xylanase
MGARWAATVVGLAAVGLAVAPAPAAGSLTRRHPAATLTVTSQRPTGTLLVPLRARHCGRRAGVAIQAGSDRALVPATPGLRTRALTAPLPAGAHALRLRLRGSPRRHCTVRAGPPAALPRAVPLGAAMRSENLDDPDYTSTFLANFDSLTPEHEMKWAAIEPARGVFDFRRADALVAFAAAHGRAVRGHALVADKPLPGWLTSPLLPWSRDQLIAIMHEHIAAVVGRYRGRVAEWDVVNEAFAPDGSLARNVWLRTIGPGYIELAFRFAREADPGAALYLTDTGAEWPGRQQDAIFALAADLRARGVSIDGVGFQNHVMAARYPSRAELETAFRRFGSAGLRTEITEMDVASPVTGALSDRLAEQTAAYAAAAQACAAVPACVRFTTWGVSDRFSWKPAAEMPLLFDYDWDPRPAYDAVALALARRPGLALTAATASRAPATPRRAAAASPRR